MIVHRMDLPETPEIAMFHAVIDTTSRPAKS